MTLRAKTQWIIYGSIAAMVLFFATLQFGPMLLFIFDDPMLHEEQLRSVHSAALGADAVLSTLDAGATTATAFHLSIGPRDDGANTVLIADHVYDAKKLRFDWSGNVLRVSLPSSARIFKKLTRFDREGKEIQIEYKETASE